MRKCWVVIVAMLSVACWHNTNESECDASGTKAEAESEQVKFPMPKIPDFIEGREERVNYALRNFWNVYDFSDTTSVNMAVGEQGFANFLHLLQYADTMVIAETVRSFVGKTFAQKQYRHLYEELVWHYLENPESPMRNDVLYLCFLKEQLTFYTENELAEKERCSFKIDMVGRNMPGSVACDFEFVERNGSTCRLHEVESPLTLLIFNDPDCEICQSLIPQLIADPLLQSKGLKVISIYPDHDTDRWKSKQYDFPNVWIDAYSPGGEIISKSLYHLPAMPSLYLLDAKKRVLLKDANPNEIRNRILENNR